MERLLWPRALLLVALLFPGLCEARHESQGGTEGIRAPRDEALRPGTNDSRGLHHPGKRYLVPLTPRMVGIRKVAYKLKSRICLFYSQNGCMEMWENYGSGFKVVNCRKSEGLCQEYCNYMEIQLGYCSKRKDACCLPQN